jgi:GntR family transcriptional regulator of vanillate catabolism
VKAAEEGGKLRSAQTLQAQLRLRQLILDGQIKPGARIPELTLVGRLGVSRTPVRAALVRLAEEGLLEASVSGGFVVRSFSVAEAYDAIDVRGTLEGAAARRAAERHPDSRELAVVRDCVRALDALVACPRLGPDEFADYVRLNELFHLQLVALARSPALERAITRIVALPFASPSAFVAAQEGLPDARETLLVGQSQHRSILEAIAAGEGARAEAAAREHSLLAKKNLRAVADRDAPLRRVTGGNLIRLEKARR